MTLTKRINAQIKELSAIEGGKVNMDAPMFRAFLKAQAKLRARQMFEGRRDFQALMNDLTDIELAKLNKPKRPKRKSKAR